MHRKLSRGRKRPNLILPGEAVIDEPLFFYECLYVHVSFLKYLFVVLHGRDTKITNLNFPPRPPTCPSLLSEAMFYD